MGRWYSGNIHGKYWFGVQDSDAMENYGAVLQSPDFQYKICGCCCDCEPQEKDYCEGCFNSYEDHIKEVRDECDEDRVTECFEEDEQNGNWLYDKDMFEDQGLPFIEEHKDLFNKYIHYFFLPHEKLQFFKNVFKLTSLKEKIEVKGLFYFRAK
jgi:hypothetical protein